MTSSFARSFLLFVFAFLLLTAPLYAQQSLGAINGAVIDASGAAVQGAKVTVKNNGTNLQLEKVTKNDGSFEFVDLPLGTYTVTFARDGFKTEVHSQILVRGNLTTTVNGSLQPGAVTSSITVTGSPLLNETDTTNGYTLGSDLIENIPLGTGSFTQLALLSPGVSADFLSGAGTNAGLGNQNIFANGQRDTSNSFNFNSVTAANFFNGLSSSSIGETRFVLNTNEQFGAANQVRTNTSVFDAIGQGMPAPPPETIEEIRVDTSLYGVSQGANSGAHIAVATKSGTNDFHGGAYEYHQSTGLEANQFFFNAAGIPRQALHRNVFGGTLGGPIKKDKLFFFGSYQGQRITDATNGSIQFVNVPCLDPANPTPATCLSNDRSAAGIAAVAGVNASQIDQAALNLLQLKTPGGQYVVPSATRFNVTDISTVGGNAEISGPPGTFNADQLNGNIDYNWNDKDRVSGKYYYQRDPTVSPFGVSNTLGFPQRLDAGSQVASIENTKILSPNMTWTQRFGFIREVAFANTQQQFTNNDFGISLFGSTRLPGININVDDANLGNPLAIGAASNFANAGLFQNQFEGSTNLLWSLGRHTLSFGFQWDHTQLNIINQNNQQAVLGFGTFFDFAQGNLCTPSSGCFSANTEILNGATNRYFRANQIGTYAQDSIRVKSNLTVNIGLRWDWDGPLVEKNGMLTNFYPQNYQYNAGTDTINNIGLVVAGNNKSFGTKGVSDSTLTGRQWGFGPRIGVAWTPSFVKNVVIRAGYGLYYDRGEYFTLLSPSSGGGISGPFGVTTEQPFVVPFLASSTSTFAVPFGTTPPPPPPANLNGVISLVPNISQLKNFTTPFCIATNQSFCGPLFFGGYDPRNTLPYTENWMLDLQWQPANDLVLRLAYVGNHGLHELLPIPFNQARIATPSNPINA